LPRFSIANIYYMTNYYDDPTNVIRLIVNFRGVLVE
jgi:hypothetical protein